jgi:hydrogenase maturation protein HypF
LGKIADFFLVHNREIHMRCDDSVSAVIAGKPVVLRRSRGYVPYPVKLQFEAKNKCLLLGVILKTLSVF